jgi:hypothetical protein
MKEDYKVGDKVTFENYVLGDDDAPLDKEIFKKGDLLVVLKVGDEEGSFIVGKEADETVQDTCFYDEIREYKAKATPKKRAKKVAKKVEETEELPLDTEDTEEVSEEPVEEKPKAKKVAKKTTKKAAKKVAKKTTKKAAKKKEPELEEEKSVAIDAKAELVEVIQTSSVKNALEGKNALEVAYDLVEQTERTYFIMGGVLADIYYNKRYVDIENESGKLLYDGNKGFEHYVSAELGIRYRKAKYLIDIYMHFTQLGADEEELSRVGWSKAKELLKATTKENYLSLIAYAEEHTREEIVEHINTQYLGDGTGSKAEPKVAMTRFKFALFEDKGNMAKEALEVAKNAADAQNDSEAFDFMVTEWFANQDYAPSSQEAAIEALEKRFNIKLEVKD